jgi:hypothetical protein
MLFGDVSGRLGDGGGGDFQVTIDSVQTVGQTNFDVAIDSVQTVGQTNFDVAIDGTSVATN